MAKVASNTFTGSQLGLTYIGKNHCYAFSGAQVSNGGVDATLLSFTTGAEYIICELCFTEDERGSNPITFRCALNGVKVIDSEYDASPMETRHVFPLLIPPLTTVFVDFTAGGSNINGTAWIVGRVYE